MGVLEGVRQGLLHHPVGHEVGAAGRLGRCALFGELHGLTGPPCLFDEGEEPAGGWGPGLGAVVGVEQVEQVPQIRDGPAAGVGDGGQALVEAIGDGGQIAGRLGLYDHRRHVVGHHVVEFAGDAGAFGGASVLGDAAAALGLQGPGVTNP